MRSGHTAKLIENGVLFLSTGHGTPSSLGGACDLILILSMSPFCLPALNASHPPFSRGKISTLCFLSALLCNSQIEYQVYLAGVFESNPAKLRNCITFHEIGFAFTEGC